MGKMKTKAVHTTPTTAKSEEPPKGRTAFFALAWEMTWKLAVVILGPIVGGVYLDNTFNTDTLFTFLGLLLAIIGSIAVMWQIVRIANGMPVPKLTAQQRRQIQKEYEEEDKDD
jgi:F0F1-type ATP synthase assembly protein I